MQLWDKNCKLDTVRSLPKKKRRQVCLYITYHCLNYSLHTIFSAPLAPRFKTCLLCNYAMLSILDKDRFTGAKSELWLTSLNI